MFVLLSATVLIIAISIPSCQDQKEIKFRKYMSIGKQIYIQRCQHCHGEKGQGLGKLYPPLDSSDYLVENRDLLACIIRNGQVGKIEVNGVVYNQVMPANPDLLEDDIAQISTYILNAWSNEAGLFEKEEVLESLGNCQSD
ncbi:cytochrome c [Hyphobacterium sp. CCMP332]|nr:cytochrome c [Hyphobacterium sp. CCMP332]